MDEESPEIHCCHTFTVFCRAEEGIVDRIRSVISRTLGPVPLDSVRVRASAKGRYRSVAVCMPESGRARIERVYEDLRADDSVLFFL